MSEQKIAVTKPHASPKITALRSRFASAAKPKAGDAMAIELTEALESGFDCDAHFCAYEPSDPPVRLAGDPADVPGGVRMVALIGDLDDPVAHASKTPARDEWREEQLDRIIASGLAHYETRGGYRVLATLAEPFMLTSKAHAEEWKARYEAWCDELEQSCGLELDRACKDWTRLYRLPNVERDGETQTSQVLGDLPMVKLPAAGARTTPPKSRTTESTDDDMARAHVIAEHWPPSVCGLGGDEALFKAASEIATVLGEDPDAIEAVLSETFNPRCVPPWDAAKLKYEAARAAGRQATAEARFKRRHDAKRERQEREAEAANNNNDPKGAVGTEAPPLDPSEDDWDAPEVPIDWYCEALGIAPSERKVTLIAGNPGSGKGPLAGHLAVCFALKLPVLGAFPCKQGNVGVLDFEGKRLTMRRIRQHARGLKRNPAELKGRIFVRDCDPGDLDFLHEWIAARKIEVLIVDSYMSAMAANEADPNSQAYAQLARDLGKLNIVVIVIAHARKLAAPAKKDEPPTLGDVAGSYALGGMAATAIAVWNPDPDDRNLARVSCLRAPDESFRTFEVRWEKDQTAPKDAQVWTGTMQGVAGKAARAEAKAQAERLAKEEEIRTRTESAEIAIVGKLAAIEQPPDPQRHEHLTVKPSLSKGKLAEHAGIHASREAPAILRRLVDDGWIEADDSHPQFTTYRLRDQLPAEPPVKRFGHFEGVSSDPRATALHAEIRRKRPSA